MTPASANLMIFAGVVTIAGLLFVGGGLWPTLAFLGSITINTAKGRVRHE